MTFKGKKKVDFLSSIQISLNDFGQQEREMAH